MLPPKLTEFPNGDENTCFGARGTYRGRPLFLVGEFLKLSMCRVKKFFCIMFSALQEASLSHIPFAHLYFKLHGKVGRGEYSRDSLLAL